MCCGVGRLNGCHELLHGLFGTGGRVDKRLRETGVIEGGFGQCMGMGCQGFEDCVVEICARTGRLACCMRGASGQCAHPAVNQELAGNGQYEYLGQHGRGHSCMCMLAVCCAWQVLYGQHCPS
jgi:hypothetical protein